jgi:hypothetical protein
LYTAAKNAFLLGDIDWVADTIKVTLVDAADYTVNLGTDDFYNDVPAGARIATATLANKTASGGVADADDVTFATVTGDQAEALVIWKDTGNEATSPLILYMDTGTGLPVTPGGGNITVTWSNGSSKIFSL